MKKILLMACGLAMPLTPAAGTEIQTLMRLGEWEIMTGDNACMMMSTDMAKPTTFGLIFKGEDYALSLQNQSWNYSGTVPLKIQFAGQNLSWDGIGTGKGILIPTGNAIGILHGFSQSYRDKSRVVVSAASGSVLSDTPVDDGFMEGLQALNQCVTLFTE